jgi:cytoskeletal protein CcmA (bactofilin family)
VGTPGCDAITPASLDSNVLGSSNKPQAQAAACVVEGGPKATLTISRSNLLAKLTFHKGAAPSTMSMGDLLLLTKERGLHDTAALRESLTRALTLAQSKANAHAGPNANPDANVLQQDVSCIIARGKPAKHATSPQLRLVIAPTEAEALAAKPVGNKLDSSKPANSQAGSEEARTDHRARSSLRIIRRDETIAIITPPQAGVDGEDVRGVLLRATAAAPLRTTLHASVKQLTDGRVIALRDGCLHSTPEELAIRGEFHIAGNVDYSTGNIDVPGSVFIAGGVADCFVVKASTDIRVAQLVDAASLEAGRDLHLEQGAAGRDLVQHRCGRDFCAPTISGLDVFIGRHASVKHEIADCRLHVQGSFDGPNCTLVRGELHAAGGACLGTLGSAGAGGHHQRWLSWGCTPILMHWRANLQRCEMNSRNPTSGVRSASSSCRSKGG